MMNRRAFLKAIGLSATGLALAPLVPFVPSLIVQPGFNGLAFHPDAFSLVMAPLDEKRLSIRFLEKFEVTPGRCINRLDVLYGAPMLWRPEWACRIENISSRASASRHRYVLNPPTGSFLNYLTREQLALEG